MITVQEGLGKKQDPINKITSTKKGWRHDSSVIVPPSKWKTVNHEFKPKYHKKKKRKKLICLLFILY
jgi:hypothetical protein